MGWVRLGRSRRTRGDSAGLGRTGAPHPPTPHTSPTPECAPGVHEASKLALLSPPPPTLTRNASLPLTPTPTQIVYRVYEPSELKPVLDAVNEEQTKEKEKK